MNADAWDRDVRDLGAFDFRQAVVTSLRKRAEKDCIDGDRYLPGGQYPAAIAAWRAAAQRRRAATDLDKQMPIHVDDRPFVTQACAEVRNGLWTRFAEENGRAA